MFNERSLLFGILFVVVFASFAAAVTPVKSVNNLATNTVVAQSEPISDLGSFSISESRMIPIRVCKGDINLDGSISFADIDPFVALMNKNWSGNLTEREELLRWVSDLNNDGATDWRDIDPFVAVLDGTVSPTCIFWPGLKTYDFVRERDIKAYICRLGPNPRDFPPAFNSTICNREFTDITSRSELDIADKNAIDGVSWTNYATHHFFVLKNVDEAKLRRFAVGYVSMNKNHMGNVRNYLYVKNFATNKWEKLSEAVVPMNKQGFMGYISKFGNLADYVNENGEMWFMGTSGPRSNLEIATDSFGATLRFSTFGIDSVDQTLTPNWMNFVFNKN